MGSKTRVRLHRHPRRKARSQLVLLLAAGAALGVLGGLQVAGMIDRAAAGGMFGAPLLPPVQPTVARPREEDRGMGAAIAAALHADEPADCRAFEPRHQAGCRAYVQDRSRSAELFGPPASPPMANASTVADVDPAGLPPWPATLD
jgi:hypothetical protein